MLYVYEVSAAHTLQNADSMRIPKIINVYSRGNPYRLACTRRGNDTLVAFTHESSVSLQRVRLASLPLNLEHIGMIGDVFTGADLLLFREDLLLVADRDHKVRKHAIVSLRATSNALTVRRVLLDAESSVHVLDWTLAGGRLVLSERKEEFQTTLPGDLLVYDFV